jgi:hypothetical protein
VEAMGEQTQQVVIELEPIVQQNQAILIQHLQLEHLQAQINLG